MNVRTSNRIVAVAAVVLLATGTALANFAGTDVFIPSLGYGPGNAGAQWYACIWVHNPNAAPVNVTFLLLLRNQANPSPQAFNDTIPAGDTRRYDDAIATMFGPPSGPTFGAVRVTTPSGQPVIVNARSYNKPTGMDDKDTTGQFYAAIPASFAIGPGQKTELLGVYQTTPQSSSEYRYNFGFVETTGNLATVLVTAYDQNGTLVGSKSYTLSGYEAELGQISARRERRGVRRRRQSRGDGNRQREGRLRPAREPTTADASRDLNRQERRGSLPRLSRGPWRDAKPPRPENRHQRSRW